MPEYASASHLTNLTGPVSSRHHYPAPTSATSEPTPAPVIDRLIRCHRCNKMLAEFASRPWSIRCLRCKAPNRGGDPERVGD